MKEADLTATYVKNHTKIGVVFTIMSLLSIKELDTIVKDVTRNLLPNINY